MKYRVDNVPWPWWPFWFGASWIVGTLWWLLLVLFARTYRIEATGMENLEGRPNLVFCLWHRWVWPFWITVSRSEPQLVIVNHPAAYMKPVHVLLRLMGVRIVLGSSGEEGRRAIDRVAEFVKSGGSTVIFPDGPDGPPEVLKKGVLQLARKSGVPVAPTRVELSRFVLLPSWDHKRVPLPFSRIRLVYDAPVVVTEDSLEEARRLLSRRLSGEDDQDGSLRSDRIDAGLARRDTR